MNINELISLVNVSVKAHFPDFKGTYFFGSRAKGNYTEESDYDFLLTFGHRLNWREKNQLYDLIAEIEMQKMIVIDVKAYQESELTGRWTPFREKVIREGIFYGAA
ncbi:MAG: nucleotidyltransferase domain-containing protein [bacterium]|nr:nucleotidyltransferase domain-containing protein [bacterium]